MHGAILSPGNDDLRLVARMHIGSADKQHVVCLEYQVFYPHSVQGLSEAQHRSGEAGDCEQHQPGADQRE